MMKIKSMLALATALAMFAVPVMADVSDEVENTTEESTQSGIQVYVNDKKLEFDTLPIIENCRTLVPVRAIMESLGADVNWDANTQTITATEFGIPIILQIGSNQMSVAGKVVSLDAPAKIVNERTYVPLRAISEGFGAEVEWNGENRTINIKSAIAEKVNQKIDELKNAFSQRMAN
jgi:hypothetical protein